MTLSRGVCQRARRPGRLRSMGLNYYRRKTSNWGDWSQRRAGDMTTGWGEGGRGSRGLARPGWRAARRRRLPLWNQRWSALRTGASGGRQRRSVKAPAGEQCPPRAGRALLGGILGWQPGRLARFGLHRLPSWMRFLAIGGDGVRAFRRPAVFIASAFLRLCIVALIMSSCPQIRVLMIFSFIRVN